MSNLHKILKLGNPKLHEVSESLTKDELPVALSKASEMHDLIIEYRKSYGAGRAIAAPQIGYQKRMIALYMDRPLILINPVLYNHSTEMMELWDDCMSFPNLLVKVRRHKKCSIRYLDENWNEQTWDLEDDLSELLQHEYDHLDGILATQRAIDDKSFALASEIKVKA
ncbi:MAG: peptide deformylase [Bacteroidales bacterium]|nr:peptide deformylase [Bacteroidales bacterium]